MCPDVVTCCASVSGFAERTLLFIVLHENKALSSTTFVCHVSSLKNPMGTSRPGPQPPLSLAGGTEGCGRLTEGLSEAPTFPLLAGARLLLEQDASCLSPRVTRAFGGF